MNKKVITEIKNLNADIKQGKKRMKTQRKI